MEISIFAVIAIAIAFVLMLVLYWHLKSHFSQFERLGIPGPKPSTFIGNLPEILRKGQFQATLDWTRRYGRVYGFFEGYTPVLSVSDPDILREVLVKDSANFMSRKPFPLAPRKSLGLFLENGHQWRRSRSLLTGAFSSGKLKQMMPVMKDSADVLVDSISQSCGQGKTLDLYSRFQCLTLDIIGRCAFGLQTHAQTDPQDEFLNNIRKLFDIMTKTIILPLVMALPFLSHFVFALKNIVCVFGMNPVMWLRMQLKEIVHIRQKMGPNSRIVDLVQLMVFPNMTCSGKNCAPKHRQMSEREIVAQSMTFLLAGYETTSAVLAFLAHVLAKHPDVQDRLYEEISTRLNKDINYESVQEAGYYDMVFDEVCRLFPTASLIVTRQAAESREFKGVKIPAGMNVHANIWALHHDPEFWDEPEVFNPERFTAENKNAIRPYTFLPFGAGPRSCIGMRFAMLETKVAMLKLLQKYRFSMPDEEQKPLELCARGAIVPKDEVKVKVTRRMPKRTVNNMHG